jgi:acetylornithine/succinyldiaminopimelate/putrescine aminotransferase
MDRFFFCNSGTEANEAAMKFARKYNGREGFIAARGSFHGRTFGSLSLTDSERYQSPFRPLLSGVEFVPYGDTDALKSAVDSKTCALFLEPLQAEGGVNVPPEGYLAAARDLCDDAGALLVLDEVQTGMGRTGEWFAWHGEGVRPDLMTIAKGMAGGVPMGALAVAEGVEAFEPGDHASTFGGGPLACASALATIETIRREGLVENARRVGAVLLDGLQASLDNHGLVEARGRGLLVGAEMDNPSAGMVKECQERGLLINCIHDTVLRMVPPLILTEKQAKDACKIVGEAAAAGDKQT